MAKLNEGQRHRMPRSMFGLPDKRSFPMPDKDHAQAALMDVQAAEKAGHITAAEAQRVIAKARRMLAS